jgi:lysozyme
MNPVNVGELASALIAVFEGCKLSAYQDSGGVWTIGIGHTEGVKQGDVITIEQARAFFVGDQAALLSKVSGLPVLEGAALVSFGFNCGLGALQEVMSGHALISQFVHDAKGHVLPGLVTRRGLEELLLLMGQEKAA